METPKNILIIIDVQNDFITGDESSKAVLSNIYKHIEGYSHTYDYIITTQDTHNIETYYDTLESQKFPIHCIKNTKGWEINKDIKEEIFQILKRNNKCLYTNIEKYDFGYMGWPFHIKEIVDSGKQTITIIGLKTDICVITNALILKTLYPLANIRIRANCCAGTTPEAHAAALQIAKSCQIEVW